MADTTTQEYDTLSLRHVIMCVSVCVCVCVYAFVRTYEYNIFILRNRDVQETLSPVENLGQDKVMC